MKDIGIPKGTRDFGPEIMIKRNYILDTIKSIFQKFGFLPLETPTMENLSVLMGKYGEEGDRLIFKILNSGQDLFKATEEDFNKGWKSFTNVIAEKGLRYDLTVPFARYVAMNRNSLTFPFKRYQIQPVWRGDKPQKGRYREFYQCDADVVGTNSLICEAEIVLMLNEALSKLGIKNFTIKINNRKILSGITEIIGKSGSEETLCVAIDKLDKIGKEKVIEELKNKGFTDDVIIKLNPILDLGGSNQDKFLALKGILSTSETGLLGLDEIQKIFNLVNSFGIENANLQFDLTLARGLSYYTGAIFEVKANDVTIGSISGGGRYDNLTGVFGLQGVSGVGISFGVDRIYDVMEELKLFPLESATTTKVLVCYFDEDSEKYSLPVLYKLRAAGIKSEVYPEPGKLKKPLNYADKKSIPYALIIGSEEMSSGQLQLKNMLNGDQERLTLEQIIQKLK